MSQPETKTEMSEEISVAQSAPIELSPVGLLSPADDVIDKAPDSPGKLKTDDSLVSLASTATDEVVVPTISSLGDQEEVSTPEEVVSKEEEERVESEEEKPIEDILDDLGALATRKSSNALLEDEEVPEVLPEPDELIVLLLDPALQSLVDALYTFAKAGMTDVLSEEDGVSSLSQATRELAMQARNLTSVESMLLSNYPECDGQIQPTILDLQALLRPIVIAVKEVSGDPTNETSIQQLQTVTGDYAKQLKYLTASLSDASKQQLLLGAQGAVKRATAIIAPTIRSLLSTGLDEPIENVKNLMQKEVYALLIHAALIGAQVAANTQLVDALDEAVGPILPAFETFWTGAFAVAGQPNPQEAGQMLVQDAKTLIASLRAIESALTDCTSANTLSPRTHSNEELILSLTLALDDFSSRVDYGSTSDLTTRLILTGARRTIKNFISETKSYAAHPTSLTTFSSYSDVVAKLLTYIKYHRIDAFEHPPTSNGYASGAMLALSRAKTLSVLAAQSSPDATAQLLAHILRITILLNKAIFG